MTDYSEMEAYIAVALGLDVWLGVPGNVKTIEAGFRETTTDKNRATFGFGEKMLPAICVSNRLRFGSMPQVKLISKTKVNHVVPFILLVAEVAKQGETSRQAVEEIIENINRVLLALSVVKGAWTGSGLVKANSIGGTTYLVEDGGRSVAVGQVMFDMELVTEI